MESSRLFEEIRRIDPKAASVLEDAGFSTDSDIQFLSREDLQELFTGNRELKRRKKIFDIIHKQKPVDALLKELRDFIPSESLKAALTDNGVLVDYLHILKSMKTQMDNVQTFLDAHINLLEDIRKPKPNQELQSDPQLNTSGSGVPMDTDLNQLHERQQGIYGSQLNTSASGGPEDHFNQPHEHQQEAYRSQLNTSASSTSMETDLNQRHERQQGIYGSKSTTSAAGRSVMLYNDQSLNYQHAHYESSSATSSTRGPVMFSNNQSYDYQQASYGSKSNTSATSGSMMLTKNQLPDYQHAAYGSKSSNVSITGQGKSCKNQTDQQRAPGSTVRSNASGEKGSYVSQTVKYRMVVSGETFGAHVQLMDNIKASLDRKVQLVESSEDPQIIFVFCPIVSRLATDANAALEDVKDFPKDAYIILVLMHHVHEVKMVTHLRTWDEVAKVELYVHVFYHEKMRGLLKCRENQDAVSQIQSKLLKMHPLIHISANAQDQSSTADSFTGGGDNSGSQNDGDNNSGSNYSQRITRWFSGQK